MGEKENWPSSKVEYLGFFLPKIEQDHGQTMAKRTLTSQSDSASMLHIRHLKIPHFPHQFSLLTSTGVYGGCRRGVWVSIVQHANNGEPNTRRKEHFPLFDVTQTDRWDGWSNSSQLWSKLNPADGIITEKKHFEDGVADTHAHAYTHTPV